MIIVSHADILLIFSLLLRRSLIAESTGFAMRPGSELDVDVNIISDQV